MAEEAGQLLDVVAARLAKIRQDGLPEAAQPSPDDTSGHTATASQANSPTCVGWCPICRSADLLRGDRPELTQKLVDSALLLVTTLRSLIPTSAEPTETTADGDGSPGIERINLR